MTGLKSFLMMRLLLNEGVNIKKWIKPSEQKITSQKI